MHWQLLVVLVLAVARPSNGSSQDLWEEIQHPSSPALTPTYVSLHSPLVALEQPEKGSTQQKMGLDHAKFDAIQSKIRGGSKHIKLIGTGVENGLELEVSPFNVFTDDVVIETDDSVGSMKLPEMLFLRGKVAGDADSFVTLHIGKHGSYGMIQSNQRTWQLGVPKDGEAHSVLMEIKKNSGGDEISKEESLDEELSAPIQLHKDLADKTVMAQSKSRATADNFDATGSEPVLSLALECDKACRDLFQASGECLTEVPTTLIDQRDHSEFKELVAVGDSASFDSDQSSSCSGWVSAGYNCETTRITVSGSSAGTYTLQEYCPDSCGGSTPTAAPTDAPASSGSSSSTDKSTSCSSWAQSYPCTTTFNFPTGETETLQEHCPVSCGPTPAPTPAPTYAAGDGVAGCTHPAATYLASVIAGASSIYSRDIGVTLQIQYMKVWSSTSPYDQGTASLNEFRSAYNGATGAQDADIAHLFTGIVEGGLAYVGTACNNAGYNTGVSSLRGTWQGSTDASAYNWDLIVTAHEMGHNVGSGHTHDSSSYSPTIDQCVDSTGSAVSRTSAACVTGTIMSYCHLCGGTANINMGFADRVKDQIKSTLSTGSCSLSLSR